MKNRITEPLDTTSPETGAMEKKPKDAGLLVMFVLVLLGTLLMAWVADQPSPDKSSAVTTGP